MTEATSATEAGRGTILVLNGPNLNLLGTREPENTARPRWPTSSSSPRTPARAHGLDVECFQSNHEGALVDAIHAARGKAIGIVLNAGAYTHTSVAIRDAISAVQLPTVEVHITNVHAREEFRHHSYLSDISKAVIAGAGILGYRFAVEYLAGPDTPARPDHAGPASDRGAARHTASSGTGTSARSMPPVPRPATPTGPWASPMTPG